MSAAKIPTRKVKLVSSNTKTILTSTNPEVFQTSPRAGGFLKVLVPTKSQDYIVSGPSTTSGTGLESDNECHCTKALFLHRSRSSIDSSLSRMSKFGTIDFHATESETNISREFRLTRAIEETDWEVTAMDETETVVGISNPLQDSVNMLAVTISCVMLMAAEVPEIPEEYFSWVQNYLACIKDDHGNHPPNIQGILNHISFLQNDGKEHFCCGADCNSKHPVNKNDSPSNKDKKRSNSNDSSSVKDKKECSSNNSPSEKGTRRSRSDSPTEKNKTRSALKWKKSKQREDGR